MKTGEFFDPRIKIRAPLRCDGIGRLDCAEDVESGARLAVRWLPLDANGDAAVRACAKLPEHPTLPRIRQTGQMGDKAYVAMEFPDGRLLATLLGEPVSGELLLEMGAQLADALATIHMQNVFHGELSAESVLLVKSKAFLWDMPLVIANRLTDRRGEERLMHQLVRTAHFLPPERACGGGASAEGDVYALAAVMCIAGGARLPHTATTLAVVHKIANNEWAPEVPAVFREPYRSLLLRMLDTEPQLRPTAREVADLLAKPVAGIPTIPEMPAIVLPAALQAKLGMTPMYSAHPFKPPRPGPAAPFFAAPGSLQPMLPSKSIAQAAVAADASRPAAVFGEVKLEPTVRVIVPPMVLESMAQAEQAAKEQVDSALRAMTAAAQASRTTDPHLKAVTGPLPVVEDSHPSQDPMSALLRGLEGVDHPTLEVTPPPAALEAPKKAGTSGPRSADAVNKALEAKSTTSGPRAAEAVSKALAVEPAAKSTTSGPRSVDAVNKALDAGPLPASVELRDNVSVSEELHAAGAARISEGELAALTQLPRAKPMALYVAIGLAVVTTALGLGARAIAKRPSSAVPMVIAAPPALAPVAVPVALPVDADEDDELGPLPQVKAHPAVPHFRRAAPVAAKVVAAPREPTSEPTESGAEFGFLPSDSKAPAKEELKRPELYAQP